jgi:hypothetical protein
VSPLLEQATTFQSLLRATHRAAAGKRHKPEVARFLMDAERQCLRLQHELRLPLEHPRSWQPGPARTFPIRDPKPRLITEVPFRDRVVHHALCAVLNPALERYAVHDSYACRVGKGQHAALRKASTFARAARDGWALKGDITAYFASIPHDRLLALLRRRVVDPMLCAWIERIVRAYPVGPGHSLPIGALTSQHLANLYLGALDHFVKDDLGVRYYLRYMDDFLACGDRQVMLVLKARVEDFLSQQLGLKLNPTSSRVLRVRDGIPLLGMRVYPAAIRPRQKRWRRFTAKQRALTEALQAGTFSEEEAAQRLTSQYAHLAKYSTHRLRCNHLARLAEASNRPGADQRRLQPGDTRRVLGQRGAERARRQPQHELARQPQPELRGVYSARARSQHAGERGASRARVLKTAG